MFLFDFKYAFDILCGFTRMCRPCVIVALTGTDCEDEKSQSAYYIYYENLTYIETTSLRGTKQQLKNTAGRQHGDGTIIWSCQSVLNIHDPKCHRCLNKSTLSHSQIYSHVQNAANARDNKRATT